jgi:hypothetical protein
MFTKLSAAEVVSIIVAAPAGSAVRYMTDGGWTVTDHLLATQLEQRAGLVKLKDRYQRPGTKPREPEPKTVADPDRITFDTMPLDEFIKRQKADNAR